MKVGHIYINGQIGSTDTERGVELQDVIAQVEQQKDVDVYHIHIKSQGGCVRVGKLIADYVGKLPNAITIADGYCASMGTEIHLAVPIENRKIVAGTNYFIHNPLVVGVSGNSDELNEIAGEIYKTEKEMLAMYVKATKLDAAALSGLMKQETSLTDSQCVAFGFASEIIEKKEIKAKTAVEGGNKKPKKQMSGAEKTHLRDKIREVERRVDYLTKEVDKYTRALGNPKLYNKNDPAAKRALQQFTREKKELEEKLEEAELRWIDLEERLNQ